MYSTFGTTESQIVRDMFLDYFMEEFGLEVMDAISRNERFQKGDIWYSYLFKHPRIVCRFLKWLNQSIINMKEIGFDFRGFMHGEFKVSFFNQKDDRFIGLELRAEDLQAWGYGSMAPNQLKDVLSALTHNELSIRPLDRLPFNIGDEQ
jgi:hypothetical protein